MNRLNSETRFAITAMHSRRQARKVQKKYASYMNLELLEALGEGR